MKSENKPKTVDGRNIIDFYFYWKNDAIKAHLDTKRFPYSILCCNIHGDYNLSTIVRCSNAFLAKEIFIYGKKHWDRRGAVGTQAYSHIHHLPNESDLEQLKNLTWVCIDNIPSATPIDEFEWPENPLLVFGEETVGVPGSLIKKCKHVVYIPQFGSVRSLNVGVAAGIVMHDFATKYNKKLRSNNA